MYGTGRQRMLARKQSLWLERSSYDSHWEEIAKYQAPRAGRFGGHNDDNRGGKKHGTILDNTAVFARRTLAAGMMSGMTSPARPWFRLELEDKDLMESANVKRWLHDVGSKMRSVFSSSNTYQALHLCYEELGAFGTWASFIAPDFENVIHHYPMATGEYALGINDKGTVDTVCRELRMTVGQMVQMFGAERCSSAVVNLYDRGSLDAWVPVIHIVEPRTGKRTPGARDGASMPFSSIYFESAAERGHDEYLRESGFKRFPALCPRWTVQAGEVYGSSPGMDVLGDVKQLQHAQMRKGQAIDYQVNPPLQVPTQYKDQAHKRLPGGVMFVDATGPGGGVRSAYDVRVDLAHMLGDIQDVRERIRQGYYADLFLMLANIQRTGMTATEVAERHEEKLLMLGPVLERLHTELLAPKIDITFDRMAEAGILPPAPREIEGQNIKISFVSTLAQAQRAVASAGADRLFETVGRLSAMNPQALDKLDFDQAIDDYADMYGVNPRIVRSDDAVAETRAARAQAQQAAQAAASAPQLVESAATASTIDMPGLQDVMGALQGYTGAAGGA